jgi:integrase
MATLQQRNGSYRVLFYWQGQRQSLTLGPVSSEEAESKSSQAEYLLMRVKQGLLTVPPGMGIAAFLACDGRPSEPPAAPKEAGEQIDLCQLKERYLSTHENSLEATSIAGIRIHFNHLTRFFGNQFGISSLGLADLQRYVDHRSKAKGLKGRRLSPATIHKEIVTLRTAWNWGLQMHYVEGRFPNKGLRYPKGTEKPPFMTREEIELQLDGTNEELWECLYLRIDEVAELLQHVKTRPAQPFVYPMICFAAHTGARRSEMVRAKVSDVNFASRIITIHEKKRDHGRTTTRRVPLTPFLAEILRTWLAHHPGGPFLFCQPVHVTRSRKKNRAASAPLTKDEFHDHFRRALRGSKWSVIRGAHTLRHSFVSACASRNVDQRLVEAWAGHMSPEMSRRYAHLWPSVQQEAMASVFGS